MVSLVTAQWKLGGASGHKWKLGDKKRDKNTLLATEQSPFRNTLICFENSSKEDSTELVQLTLISRKSISQKQLNAE